MGNEDRISTVCYVHSYFTPNMSQLLDTAGGISKQHMKSKGARLLERFKFSAYSNAIAQGLSLNDSLLQLYSNYLT